MDKRHTYIKFTAGEPSISREGEKSRRSTEIPKEIEVKDKPVAVSHYHRQTQRLRILSGLAEKNE